MIYAAVKTNTAGFDSGWVGINQLLDQISSLGRQGRGPCGEDVKAMMNVKFNTVLQFYQKEELDEHNVQVAPPGFHVLFIPFADDFRKIKLDEDLPRGKWQKIRLEILLKLC